MVFCCVVIRDSAASHKKGFVHFNPEGNPVSALCHLALISSDRQMQRTSKEERKKKQHNATTAGKNNNRARKTKTIDEIGSTALKLEQFPLLNPQPERKLKP